MTPVHERPGEHAIRAARAASGVATLSAMSLLAGPVLALAGLLAFSGVQKVAWPDAAAEAMRAAGLPGSPGAGGQLRGRLLGLVEIAAAVAALVWGNAATAAALTVVYAAFALFSWRLLVRTDATASCGCFGQAEAPVTRLHVVLNTVAAAGLRRGRRLAHRRRRPPCSATSRSPGCRSWRSPRWPAWLWYVMLEVIPDLQAALHGGSRPSASTDGVDA